MKSIEEIKIIAKESEEHAVNMVLAAVTGGVSPNTFIYAAMVAVHMTVESGATSIPLDLIEKLFKVIVMKDKDAAAELREKAAELLRKHAEKERAKIVQLVKP